MKVVLTSFIAGVVFAVGLGISGMTQPAKVIGFLDFAGNWDPSLAFVMIGAIAVHAFLYQRIRTRPTPLFSTTFAVPTRADIDTRLLGGAALFGLGWGIAGFCPGPALTSLAAGHAAAVTFVTAMIAGMYVYTLVETLQRSPTAVTQRDATLHDGVSAPAFQSRHDS